MGYPRRHIIDNAVFHVMNRGAARQPIFADDADRVEFGRLLGEVHERFGIECLAYCLMGNHYHLLMRCPSGGLSEAMQHLGSVYTRHANDRSGRDGPLFRSRYRSLLVDSDRYLLTAVRYIHRNALDVDGIVSVEQYRWSSHRTYLGHRRRPDFLRTDLVLSYFDGDRSAFHRFVQSSDGTTTHHVDVAYLSELVWLAQSRLEPASGTGPSRAAAERTLLLLLADRIGGSVGDDLFDALGTPGGAARHSALSRARRRLRTSAEIAACFEFVIGELDATRRAS